MALLATTDLGRICSTQDAPQKSSFLLAVVCASIVADHDPTWLARPVAQLIPDGGPRPEWVSRAKVRLRTAFAKLVEAATRRGRRPAPPRDHRTAMLEALLGVTTRVLALSQAPLRRRDVQDELVCAFDPALCQPSLARHVATLLVATYLRVYAAGRCHLGHLLEGQDPDVLRAIVEEQRARARAEDRSARLFLEGVHAEYAMPGSCEAFVRTFRHYPLEDLHDAERRFRAHACRCKVRVCDRYFAAVVRDVHEAGGARRSTERRQRRDEGQARRDRTTAAQRAAEL